MKIMRTGGIVKLGLYLGNSMGTTVVVGGFFTEPGVSSKLKSGKRVSEEYIHRLQAVIEREPNN